MTQRRVMNFFDIKPGATLIQVNTRSASSYECVKARPYIRKQDGEESILYTWRGWCRACGSEFEFKTGVNLLKGFVVHCEKHRLKTVAQRRTAN